MVCSQHHYLQGVTGSFPKLDVETKAFVSRNGIVIRTVRDIDLRFKMDKESVGR